LKLPSLHWPLPRKHEWGSGNGGFLRNFFGALPYLFFKRNRYEYYALLQRVRTDGDWEAWIRFFLEAVETTAEEAVASARRAMALFATHEKKIRDGTGAASGSVLSVFRVLQVSPIVNVPMLVRETKLSKPMANAAVRSLCELGILRELTGKRRYRMFGYDEYLKMLQEEELLAADRAV